MAGTKSTAATGGATVTVKGKKFTLAKRIPFRFLVAAQDENLREIVSLLLGDEQAETFWGLDLDIKEGTKAVSEMAEKAGASLGES